MYLVAILDWYSRYVISWALDQTLEMPFVLTAMQRALTQATPHICNSDQGSHFTSPQYCQLLQDAHVQISMDGKGRALDNILILYPSLRVKFPQGKREVVGDLVPRALGPVRMEAENLQINSDLCANVAAESHGLTKFRAKCSIGPFKQ